MVFKSSCALEKSSFSIRSLKILNRSTHATLFNNVQACGLFNIAVKGMHVHNILEGARRGLVVMAPDPQ